MKYSECLRLILLSALILLGACSSKQDTTAEFVRLMNAGKAQFDSGQTAAAIDAFEKARAVAPTSIEAVLNLAMAQLRAGKPEDALRNSAEVLKLDPTSAPALYISGCSLLRMGKAESALKFLQQTKEIDRTVNAVSYQLGRAHQELGQFEEAAKQFQEVIEFEPDHPAGHYSLGQTLMRLNRQEEATREIQKHQQVLAARGSQPNDPFLVEKCVYTTARAPFIPEEPAIPGVKVTFSDASTMALGEAVSRLRGPVAILDTNHRGTNDLFVRDGTSGFRLLVQSNGVFRAKGEALPVPATNEYSSALAGDLDNDRNEDVIILGEQASHVYRFGTNGNARETTPFIGLKNLKSAEGVLIDLDFTGKLDLLSTVPGTNSIRVRRNLGNLFTERGITSGPPASIEGVLQITVDDWNNDDLPDLWLTLKSAKPKLLIKQRGGGYAETNAFPDIPTATSLSVGDFNNDLHSDIALATVNGLVLVDGVSGRQTVVTGPGPAVRNVKLIDYDNDGWLDVLCWGEGARIWRNQGKLGFKETTSETGLDKLGPATIDKIHTADLDSDGDTDFLFVMAKGSLKLVRNEGANENQQLKLRLLGNRSNASGLGHRIELVSGGLRIARFVRELPVEIGVGKHRQLETLTVKWSDLAPPIVDVPVSKSSVIPIVELQSPTGSCPYVYVWDGSKYRFVTDILGASPVGLPVAEGRYIEADPAEWIWLGDEASFQPKDGSYRVQITEELREVLYLDEARLAVVDHSPDVEVHSTGKLLPGRPFPSPELLTLSHRKKLLSATRLTGEDVTSDLAETDGRWVSPKKLRDPQTRGLAEPHGLDLDFGILDQEKPLVLALTGWLRFGGGMANMSASRHADFPFPFPQIEARTGDGKWQRVDVIAGAPAGKTKTILIELSGKLPPGTTRLRVTTAFEIHWDRAAMFEKDNRKETLITQHRPDQANLRWRGFSSFEDRPWYEPLTPDYANVSQRPPWRLSLSGWCTRYGDVKELLNDRDEALVLVNGGDELALEFSESKLPPPRPGMKRDFFLYTDGWDKDADFHVKLGWTVDPLPFHGMDDQAYGSESRPAFKKDDLMQKTRTRWNGTWALPRTQQARK